MATVRRPEMRLKLASILAKLDASRPRRTWTPRVKVAVALRAGSESEAR